MTLVKHRGCPIMSCQLYNAFVAGNEIRSQTKDYQKRIIMVFSFKATYL